MKPVPPEGAAVAGAVPRSTLVPVGIAAWVLSVGLFVATAALGPSAAEPPLPGGSPLPHLHIAAHPSAGLVIGLQLVAILAGGMALWLLLRQIRGGWRVDPRWVLASGLAAVVALLLVPPIGGSDLESYAAYGHLDAVGVNPYLHGPQAAGVPQDAITRAVEDPWRTTPSAYGPLFTGLCRLLAPRGVTVADAVLRIRLAIAVGFVLTGVALYLFAGDRRRRAALLWTANPLLLAALVAGGHVDGLAVLGVVLAFALLRRRPTTAGVLTGLAIAVKASAGLGLLAGGYALWRQPGRLGRFVVASGATAAAFYLGPPGVFDQLRAASRFLTPASPWRWVGSGLERLMPWHAARTLVGLGAALLVVSLAVLLLDMDRRARRGGPAGMPRALGVFGFAWATGSAYVLPWYDAFAWAGLAAAGASVVDALLVVHTTVLSLAFLPGRDVVMHGATDYAHIALHSVLSPAAVTALIVATVVIARRGTAPVSPAGCAGRAAPSPRTWPRNRRPRR